VRGAAACLAVAAYAGLSHYCNAVAGASAAAARDLGAGLTLAPMTLIALLLVWRRASAPVALPLTAAFGAIIYGLWPLFRSHYSLFNLVEESGVYGLLGVTFARSLLPGHTAVCTHLADKVQGPLAPHEVRYTRQVTAAWAIFFFAVVTLSVLLYSLAPLRVWSIYMNFCVLPLVIGMFIAENLVRRWVLPQGVRAGVLATMRVYFATPP
jgi:uncharacterized membrane protein